MKSSKLLIHSCTGLAGAAILAAGLGAVSPAASYASPQLAAALKASDSRGGPGEIMPKNIQEFVDQNRRNATEYISEQLAEQVKKAALIWMEKQIGQCIISSAGAFLASTGVGLIASFILGLILDGVLGSPEDMMNKMADQIVDAVESIQGNADIHFDQINRQLQDLGGSMASIKQSDAKSAYVNLEQSVTNGPVKRLRAAITTKQKLFDFMAKDHSQLSPADQQKDTDKLQALLVTYEKEATEVQRDANQWRDSIIGSSRNPGLIARYNGLTTGSHRFINAWDYRNMQNEAWHWYGLAMQAGQVGSDAVFMRSNSTHGIDTTKWLEGDEIPAPSMSPSDRDFMKQYWGEGVERDAAGKPLDAAKASVLDRIDAIVPKAQWSPLKQDGTPDPNGRYLVDSKTGAIVIPEQFQPTASWSPIEFMGIGNFKWGETPQDLKQWADTSVFYDKNEKADTKEIKAPGWQPNPLEGSRPTLTSGSLFGSGTDVTALQNRVQRVDASGAGEGSSIISDWNDPVAPSAPEFVAVAGAGDGNSGALVLAHPGKNRKLGSSMDVQVPGSDGTKVWAANFSEDFEVLKPGSAKAELTAVSTMYPSRPCGTKEKVSNAPLSKGMFPDQWVTAEAPTSCQLTDSHSLKPVQYKTPEGIVVWFVPASDVGDLHLNIVGASPKLR